MASMLYFLDVSFPSLKHAFTSSKGGWPSTSISSKWISCWNDDICLWSEDWNGRGINALQTSHQCAAKCVCVLFWSLEQWTRKTLHPGHLLRSTVGKPSAKACGSHSQWRAPNLASCHAQLFHGNMSQRRAASDLIYWASNIHMKSCFKPTKSTTAMRKHLCFIRSLENFRPVATNWRVTCKLQNSMEPATDSLSFSRVCWVDGEKHWKTCWFESGLGRETDAGRCLPSALTIRAQLLLTYLWHDCVESGGTSSLNLSLPSPSV